MTINFEPIGFVEGSRGNRSHARTHLGGVTNGGAAFRAEIHFQPTVTFVGAMFAFGQFALRNFDRFFVEHGKNGESARQSSLAKFAMAHGHKIRLTVNPITNRAAGATTAVNFIHACLQIRMAYRQRMIIRNARVAWCGRSRGEAIRTPWPPINIDAELRYAMAARQAWRGVSGNQLFLLLLYYGF